MIEYSESTGGGLMLIKNEYAKNATAWCGLNRNDMKPEEADCVIFGIPFDGGASYRGGAWNYIASIRNRRA